MGTWAIGVYGNDSALDWIHDTVRGIEKTVRASIGKFDESDGDWLLAAVDTMYVICRNAGTAPHVDEVLQWQERYLRSWDLYIRELADPEYIAAQRKVIDETFDRLAALSKSFWDPPKI